MAKTAAATHGLEEGGYAYLDSIIIACSYLDALAAFRFGQGRDAFVRLLQEYSKPDQQGWYHKISCLYLDQPPLDRDGNVLKPFDRNVASRVRCALYGKAVPNAREDISLDEAAKRLAERDIQMSKERLNRLSYAAYFYERYRCRGFILNTLTACIDNFEAEALTRLKTGQPPNSADDYRWLKQTYGLKSSFIETVCAYYRPGPRRLLPATPRGSI